MEAREGGLERVTVKQLYALSPGEGVGTDAGRCGGPTPSTSGTSTLSLPTSRTA